MRFVNRCTPLAAVAALALTGAVAVPVAGAAPSAKPKPVVKKVKVAAATLTAAKRKAVVKKVKVAAATLTAAKRKAVVKRVKVAAATLTAAKRKAVVKRVKVADDFYSPTKLTIKVGDKVYFVWQPTNVNTHIVTLVSGPKGVTRKKFSSLDASTSFHFERTFTVPGKYHFQCTLHPTMMNVFLTVKK